MALSKKELKRIIFKEYSDPEKKGLSPKTIKNRRNSLQRFFKFVKGSKFNLDICESYLLHLSKKGLQNSSIAQEQRIIKALVRWLFNKGHIENNFCSDWTLTKVRKKAEPPVPIELAEKIIIAGTKPGKGDNARNRWLKKEARDALMFIVYTGLRVGEVVKLRGKDVFISSKQLRVKGKSGNEELVPIIDVLLPMLKKRTENDRLYRITPSHLNTCLKRGCKKENVNQVVTAHGLRHSFSVSLLNNGLGIQFVSKLLRHANIKTTFDYYSRLAIEDQRKKLNIYHPLSFSGLSKEEAFDTINERMEEVVNNPNIKKYKDVNVDISKKGSSEVVYRLRKT